MSDQQRIETIKQFVKQGQQLATDVEQQDRQAFINRFQAVSGWMGDFTEQAQARTDKIL